VSCRRRRLREEAVGQRRLGRGPLLGVEVEQGAEEVDGGGGGGREAGREGRRRHFAEKSLRALLSELKHGRILMTVRVYAVTISQKKRKIAAAEAAGKRDARGVGAISLKGLHTHG